MICWIVGLAAAFGLTATGVQAEPFRLAVVGAPAGCSSLGADASPAERAYHAHLAKRLDREIQRCGYASPEAAGAGLAQGSVDAAWLDPVAFAPVQSRVRALLTVRGANEANRIPITVAVRAADPARDLASLKGRRIGFGGRSPAALAAPQAVLADRGLTAGRFSPIVYADGDVLLSDLRAGRIDAAAVHAAAWQRVCRMVSPKAPQPCADLRVVVKARPRAAQAFSVRRDIPDELRYRLIGIHLPLHLEAPAAFTFAVNGARTAAEFQPAEADALTLATLK
ncbi:MAG: PhnD/SsuA/transferrin family substrate-binding protein [Phenylobacterium sp.]|jgi:ABC-type phosphate/phosphonate transport system substrate-binding protein